MTIPTNICTDIDAKLARAAYDQIRLIFQGEYDRFVARTLANATAEVGRPPSCSLGCDACCFLRTYCTPVEAMAMLWVAFGKDAMRPPPFFFARLAARLGIERAGTTDADWMALDMPCIFLDERGAKCTVYGVRPAVCRAYHSFDHPSRCERPGKVLSVTSVTVAQTSCSLESVRLRALSLSLGLPAKSMPMPVAIDIALRGLYRGDYPESKND